MLLCLPPGIFGVGSSCTVYTWSEVTSQNLWPRYDRHFVGITWHNVCSQGPKIGRAIQWRSQDLQVGAQGVWWRGTGGLGNGGPSAGSRGRAPVGWFGGHSLPKAHSSY